MDEARLDEGDGSGEGKTRLGKNGIDKIRRSWSAAESSPLFQNPAPGTLGQIGKVQEIIMSKDEQEIRQLVATWFAATRSGDTETILSLMADDVVFLRPGEPVMHKDNFREAARKQTGAKIEGSSDIQELCIFDEWAYMWNRITVTMTPSAGARPTTRCGDTLTILRKCNGKWVLSRDANMLAELPN